MTFLPNCLKIWGRSTNSLENTQSVKQPTLRAMTPGQQTYIAGFSRRISPEKRALLQAYGVVPGYPVRVMQHSPVSVIQVEHSEIALEPDLAAEIFVKDM